MTEAELENGESTEVEAESAPAEEKHEGFIKVEESQRQVNKQHRKYRDEERARRKVESELETAKRELEELKAKANQVEVPPLPDPYDEDYEAKAKAREDAIRQQAKHEAAQTQLEERAKQKEMDAKAKEEERLNAQAAEFDSNMVKLGLNPIEVKQAAITLIDDYRVPDTLQDILMEDEDGPLLVQYLANNPLELESLSGKSALQMVKAIDGDIRQKASLLKPKTSDAPDPPDTLSGGGVREIEDPLLKGAVFE